ncbi:MAG: peptide ABC transporter substrate-binding protein [Treponema sp.]
MSINTLKKITILTAAAAVFLIPIYADPSEPELPEDKQPQEQNDSSTNQNDEPPLIIPDLQQNFTIIDAVHTYDLNPHTASYSSEAQILTGLYEGLFSYDPSSLEPLYALATSYRISRNKLRWTFILRDNAKFSDGTPVTAQDVCESWLDLLAEPDASYSSLLDIIKGASEYRAGTGKRDDVAVKAVNNTTLTINLIRPASYLPRVLCHSAFAVCKKDLSVFSGPFCIKSYKNNTLILKKNSSYWDAANTHLNQITILQSDNADENAFSFNTGSADWVTGNADVQKLLNKNVIQLTAEFATEYLFFKCRNGSIWSNSDFRAALLEAVPWDKLREKSFVKATTLVYPLSGYPQVNGYSYTDTDEAAALMKEARKNAGIPADKKIPLIFAITDTDFMKERAQLFIDAWSPLGIDVQIQKTPVDRYLSSIPSWNADLFSYTWIGDFADPLAFLELFQGNSTLNVTGWANSDYDKLLDEAALYTDENRPKLLGQAEQLLLDSGMVIPVSHPVSLNIINLDAVGGWTANAFDMHPLKYLYKKQVKQDIPNMVMR